MNDIGVDGHGRQCLRGCGGTGKRRVMPISSLLVVLVTASALLAGCDGQDTKPAETAQDRAPGNPEACMKAAKLDRVERYERNVWRGFAPHQATIVAVERLGTTDARLTAQETTDVWAYAVGPYFVHGPAKGAEGSFTTKVADCLRAGNP